MALYQASRLTPSWSELLLVEETIGFFVGLFDLARQFDEGAARVGDGMRRVEAVRVVRRVRLDCCAAQAGACIDRTTGLRS